MSCLVAMSLMWVSVAVTVALTDDHVVPQPPAGVLAPESRPVSRNSEDSELTSAQRHAVAASTSGRNAESVQKRLNAVEKIIGEAILTNSIPTEHKSRLRREALKILRPLLDPIVAGELGGVGGVVVTWKPLKQGYTVKEYKGMSGVIPSSYIHGEQISLSVQLGKLAFSISETWKSHFPSIVNPNDSNDMRFCTAVFTTYEFYRNVCMHISRSAIARISIECEDLEFRLVAIDALTDQALLAKLAFEDQNEKARVAAIVKITDQSLLGTIVAKDENSVVRVAAVERFTDQRLLAKYAVEDKDKCVRCAATKNILDQSVLSRIAIEDKDWLIRATAVGRLTDQLLLTKIAVGNDDSVVRAAAVRKVTDESILSRLAVKAKDMDVQHAAEERLSELRNSSRH